MPYMYNLNFVSSSSPTIFRDVVYTTLAFPFSSAMQSKQLTKSTNPVNQESNRFRIVSLLIIKLLASTQWGMIC